MPENMLTADELSELRDRLDEIDTAIIDLIARPDRRAPGRGQVGRRP